MTRRLNLRPSSLLRPSRNPPLMPQYDAISSQLIFLDVQHPAPSPCLKPPHLHHVQLHKIRYKVNLNNQPSTTPPMPDLSKDTIQQYHTMQFMLPHDGINTNALSLLHPSRHLPRVCHLFTTLPLL